MADFNAAIGVLLANEGGRCCDPNDPGGATAFGIDARSHPGVDIADLTREQAVEIYRKEWFLDGVTNQAIATKLFDMAVNMGKQTAVKLLQEALNGMGGKLALDGGFGPNTLLGTNAADPAKLLNALRENSAGHYRALVAHNPKLAGFLKGWLKRAAE